MANDRSGNDGREAGRKGALTADPREREAVERNGNRQALEEFLGDASQEVEHMRGMAAELSTGDPAPWLRLQNIAHNLAARSQILELGVLNACARELQQLVDERQKGAPLDDFFLQCVTGAIETLAIELDVLKRS